VFYCAQSRAGAFADGNTGSWMPARGAERRQGGAGSVAGT
jgi:hypothetical protein